MPFLGKEVRLRRLFNKSSNRLLAIAFDHAIGWGVIDGIQKIQDSIDKIASCDPDAMTLQKGLAETCMRKWAGRIPLILKSTSFSPFYPSYDGYTASVEEAIRLGADAISVGVTVGGAKQPELVKNLALVIEKAALYGLPVVTHIYPKGEFIKENDRMTSDNVAYAARVAAELGVDIIKTFYTGDPDSYRKVIESCPARVVISGGPKMSNIEDVFRMTRDGIGAGAAGVTFGRNVWQHNDPQAVMQALKGIIHGNISIDAAMKLVVNSESRHAAAKG